MALCVTREAPAERLPGRGAVDSHIRAAGYTPGQRYRLYGYETLRPVAASDDGVHTRLTFGAKAELPAIFTRNDDGSESLLNFSVADGDVIVHRVARRFVLRRGRLTGCIVNKGFIGSGERLESGTVAPDVPRERKGVPQ